MSSTLRTIRNFVFWSYERGTRQYDLMVMLIVAFVLFSPRWINFNDKPVERIPHPTGVVVAPDGKDGFIYEVPASAVRGRDDAAIMSSLLSVIEPIAGEVEIRSFEPVRDRAGNIEAYRVRVRR